MSERLNVAVTPGSQAGPLNSFRTTRTRGCRAAFTGACRKCRFLHEEHGDDGLREHLLDWLRDAHAMEQQAEQMLKAQAARIEHYP